MKFRGLRLMAVAGAGALALAGASDQAFAKPSAPATALDAETTRAGSLLTAVAYRPARVRRILRRNGWREITFVDRNLPVYVVRACRRGTRYELRLNRFGKIRRQRDLGQCRVASNGTTTRPSGRLSVQDVRRVLRGLGYRNINFRDRELPVYVADACRRQTRFRMRINRRGDINFRERIGRCGRDGAVEDNLALRPPQIKRLLEGRGFNRVRFTDRNLPTYVVEACKNNRKLELRLNRRGEIRNRNRLGTCAEIDGQKAYTPVQIRENLRAQRYYRIRFTDRQLPWYKANACRNRREFSLLINRWGDIRRRRQTGVCEAPRRDEVIEVAPRRRIDLEALRRRTNIDADECQDYLEGLLQDNTINFAVNSARINEESHELLQRLAFVATRCPETNVEIAGHTDADGSRADNQRLSERRARSVVNFLIDRDVSRSRLTAAGYGEDRPIASNNTRSGKARNRRIEFVVSWGE